MLDVRFQIACACGTSRFAAHCNPLMRAICHCTICQRFNQAAYGDIAVFLTRHVTTIMGDAVAYVAHKNPPLVLRGTCTACNAPAIERLRIPLMPKLSIVPTANLTPAKDLPDPVLHMFYDSRVQDARDHLPKHTGYLASQTAFSVAVVRGMIARRA